MIFLIARDVLLPEVRNVEVWFGYELTGWLALATAPLHYAIFAVGALGFWQQRAWVWTWGAGYAFYVAASHLIWNITSEQGEGLGAGVCQLLLFSIPGLVLLLARPRQRPSMERSTR